MKVSGIRKLRSSMASMLSGGEPVLVTRHGKVSGVFLPLEDPNRLPDDLRGELAAVLGRHLAKLLELAGVGPQDIAEDFDAYRRSCR